MHALNHSLEKTLLEADGRYLNTQELQPLERYIESYSKRLEAYHHLRDGSEKLIVYALRKLAQTYPELIQQHGARCKYDMTEVLRYIALSILLDDEILFKEQMIVWLDTVLVAYKRNAQCGKGYRNLQEAVAQALPASDSNLIRPYLNIVIQTLESHA